MLTAAVALTATAGAAAIVAVAVAPAGAAPAPTVASVTVQLHTISRQNEALSEQLNLAVAEVKVKNTQLTQAQATAAAAAAEYARQRSLLRATFAAQYEGSTNFSRTGALLNSGSGEDYANKLATLQMMSMHRTEVLSQVVAAQGVSVKAQVAADALLKTARAKQASIQQQKTALAVDQKKFQGLLLRLTIQQQMAFKSVGKVNVVSQNVSQYMIHAGPAAAQTAVNFAVKQTGKPYVYGAAGPGSYDCSGLTMAAWAAAGVSLPHNAAAQYSYGTHVAEKDLQPGDLIFMYQPIGHVTIYIGNGLMVSAPEPGENVEIVTVASQQDIYTGATRLT